MAEQGLSNELEGVIKSALGPAEAALEGFKPGLEAEETGEVVRSGKGVAVVSGLPRVKTGELILIDNRAVAMALDLEPEEARVVLLTNAETVKAGAPVKRLKRIADVPVGSSLLGRVVDPLGRPLDNGPEIVAESRYPAERPSPSIIDRIAVTRPVQTGIIAIDALIPIGRGQRELIIGDRQTGKTAVAVDTIINQRGKSMICVYCSIGQQGAATARVLDKLRSKGAMEYTFMVAASGEEPPALNFLAPYAATSMAEYFMEKGKDVLIVYDDLSHHARSYRELTLLLRRPPAREAFPGDIFYIHSRLLERATHLSPEKGGGSLTALPIVETEMQNIAAYIPTNLVSITDGQVYLSPKLFRDGVLPAIDTGKSVSRVGGAAQLPAYRAVAGDLKLAYSQFEELEVFERFSTRMDEATQKSLTRGHRIREALKQPQYATVPVAEQVALLLAVTSGLLDGIAEKDTGHAISVLRKKAVQDPCGICREIEQGKPLTEQGREMLLKAMKGA